MISSGESSATDQDRQFDSENGDELLYECQNDQDNHGNLAW